MTVDPFHERIPSEILTDIFINATNDGPLCFPPDFTSPHWVLGRVCQRWRNIARYESRLWNDIKIVNAKDAAHNSKSIEFAVRSLPAHGSICLIAKDTSNDLDSLFSSAVISQLVIPNLPRMRALNLHLRSAGYPLLLNSPSDLFTSLELLDLSFDSYVLNNAIIHASQNTPIFNKARNLKILSITSSFSSQATRFAINLLEICIPWSQLTILDFRPSPLCLGTVCFILRQTTSLEYLTISLADLPQSQGHIYSLRLPHSSPSLPMDDVVLPHLKYLSLWLTGLGRVFQYLVLPSLTTLQLQGLVPPVPYTSIAHMLSRSQCHLDIFIGGGRASPDTTAMHELMGHLSGVRQLYGRGLMVEESTLRMIGSGELLPAVEVLECDFECPKVFVEALERRLEAGCRWGSSRARDRDRDGDGDEHEMKSGAVGNGNGTKSGIVSLEVAAGQCPRTGRCSEHDFDEAMARLEKLNIKYGTRYSLEWMPGPSRDLW